MANFEAQVQESQSQVAEAQAKIAELTSRIESARQKMKEGTDVSLDIENATLNDVHSHTDLMNANIAELIMGLMMSPPHFQKISMKCETKRAGKALLASLRKPNQSRCVKNACGRRR